MIDYYEPNIDLVLVGCGFLGGYHLGAIHLLKTIWPNKAYQRVTGASCGGLLGAIVVAGVDLNVILSNAMDILRSLRHALSHPTKLRGVLSIVYDTLDKILPENAHKMCSGRFGLTITDPWTFDWSFISEFECRKDLIDAVVCGSYIPLWSGSIMFPQYKGKCYLDGGFTNNKPLFEDQNDLELVDSHQPKQIIGMSPFECDVEVTPHYETYWWTHRTCGLTYKLGSDSLLRAFHALIPFRISTYKQYFQEGFEHMKEYLLTSDLIKCKECYLASETKKLKTNNDLNTGKFALESSEPESAKISSEQTKVCLTCLAIKERVESLEVSQEMMSLMDD